MGQPPGRGAAPPEPSMEAEAARRAAGKGSRGRPGPEPARLPRWPPRWPLPACRVSMAGLARELGAPALQNETVNSARRPGNLPRSRRQGATGRAPVAAGERGGRGDPGRRLRGAATLTPRRGSPGRVTATATALQRVSGDTRRPDR